ncbi:PP2C family protein-serine/threonine phosphatase [Fulvivirga lutea]|uniref:Serine/threonine-protein phosphatase n=1 Tax=Fulvivirga lutea TaxID=2810512 RepID=A0A975A2C4_9BACT|nr:PP2C family protein-serine/threonine phosphatase [Fulvivirga lutea]QSE98382.1 serine/threonine-protein phosphatase [Fulvivirga lutea]
MLSAKAIIRLSTLVSILSWVALVFTDLSIVFSSTSSINPSVDDEVPKILLSLFAFSVFLYYKFKIEKAESINFVDLLWKVFVTGLVVTIVSLFFRLILNLLGNTKLAGNVVFLDFLYLVNLGLIISFLVSTFVVWKRLILYQKSKFLLTTWKVFEYALLGSLVYSLFGGPAVVWFREYYITILILMGLFLSANMKWVAYLNFKQKWKSILLIALAMFYLGYFSVTLYGFSVDISEQTNQFQDFRDSVFVTSMISFIFVYALFSLLVILFNLPTSSVFEQKLEEVLNFQRLSQSIQTEQNEERVYDILLESSVSTVFADAAWIELHDTRSGSTFFTHHIEEDEILKIKKHFVDNNIKGILDKGSDRTKNLGKYLATLKATRFRSMIAFPVHVKGKQEATLALLKEVSDGFNKENANIIDAFSNQAGISIENFRLLSEALQNERYKEELKIAKKVQSSLLPKDLAVSKDFEVTAFSEAADEVGGDYYDTLVIDDHRVAIIISDVSGKGTSAAFHMSQMKGVFQSLAQLGLEPKEFLVKANTALSKCLDKTSFITTSFFVVDTKKKVVEFARAGHCPTLYFDSEKKQWEFFQNKGLGLGILRNGDFANFIQPNKFSYKPGDIIILYTDGITEAKNMKGHEFGYERLQEAVTKTVNCTAEEIQKAIIDDLYEFTGTPVIDDDYTTVVIKFRES